MIETEEQIMEKIIKEIAENLGIVAVVPVVPGGIEFVSHRDLKHLVKYTSVIIEECCKDLTPEQIVSIKNRFGMLV